MQTIRETVGTVTFLIQTMEDSSVQVLNASPGEPKIMPTKAGDDIKKVYENAKSIIRTIAKDMGAELNALKTEKDTHPPKQMEVEFNMGLSAQAGIWVLGVQNSYALKVKMIWEA